MNNSRLTNEGEVDFYRIWFRSFGSLFGFEAGRWRQEIKTSKCDYFYYGEGGREIAIVRERRDRRDRSNPTIKIKYVSSWHVIRNNCTFTKQIIKWRWELGRARSPHPWPTLPSSTSWSFIKSSRFHWQGTEHHREKLAIRETDIKLILISYGLSSWRGNVLERTQA